MLNKAINKDNGYKTFLNLIENRHLEPIHLSLVEELSDSERGNNGFGSTGR